MCEIFNGFILTAHLIAFKEVVITETGEASAA